MLKFEGTDKIRDIKYEDGYVDKIYYDNNTQLVFTSDKEKTGVDEVQFKGRKLVDVTSYGKCIQTNLPLGYDALKYLQSDGNQMIDLGLKWTYTIGTEVECEQLAYGSLAIGPIGVKNVSGIWGDFVASNGTHYVCFGDKIDKTYKMLMVDGQFHTYTINNTAASMDGVVKTTDIAGSNSSLVSTNNIGLFGRYDANGNIERCGSWRVKYAKIYNSGLLIHHFVPARRKSDTILGMYDLVSGQFFTNAGTGNFIAGPDAVPTPDAPVDIVSNNGVLKAGNIYNFATNSALFNANNGNGWFIDRTNSILNLGSSANNTTWAIPCKPNTDYTVSYVKGNISNIILRLGWITSPDLSFVNTGISQPCTYVLGVDDGTRFTATIKTGSQATYVIVQVGSASYYQGDIRSALNLVIGNAISSIYTDGTVETINVHGKNLFDVNTMLVENKAIRAGSVSADKPLGSEIDNNTWNCTDYISVLPDTTYTYTIPKSTYATAAGTVFYSNKSVDGAISGISQNESLTMTFTTPSNCQYVRFSWRSGNGNDVQLEQSPTATSYEPYYNGGTATAEMLLKVGDYQDVQSVLDGEVTRKVGIKVLDGTESFTAMTTAPNTFRFIFSDNRAGFSPICSHYLTAIAAQSVANMPDMAIKGHVTIANTYYIKDSRFSTADELRGWLADQYNAGTPVIIVYPLAEPTTEQVQGQQLTIQQGNNTIEITQASVDDIQLKVKYK